MPEKVEA